MESSEESEDVKHTSVTALNSDKNAKCFIKNDFIYLGESYFYFQEVVEFKKCAAIRVKTLYEMLNSKVKERKKTKPLLWDDGSISLKYMIQTTTNILT